MGGGVDDIDLEHRDPMGLNSHVQCQFEDIFGEPAGAHSIDCVWKNAFRCFECGKNICYKLATLCCGLCIALYWGCDFACVAFDHIWFWTPCLREFAICVGCFRKVYGTVVDCLCGPCCEACAHCFSKIRISKG